MLGCQAQCVQLMRDLGECLIAACGYDALEVTVKGLSISHAVEQLCHNPERQQHLRLAEHSCTQQPSHVTMQACEQ